MIAPTSHPLNFRLAPAALLLVAVCVVFASGSFAAKQPREQAAPIKLLTSGGQSDIWNERPYDPADLWAYQPLREVAVPWESLDATAPRHPVDAFIERGLEAAKLSAAPPAERRAWIRRASFGLTGLPPAPEMTARFLADDSPDAVADLIDQLLASPRYGERMAQHWLDVVRYADTAGFSNDYEQPTAWRYRDYVIRSFNIDKPFDRFIIEQIAGDELASPTPESLLATGFLRMGPWEHTFMSVADVTRQQYLDDVTNIVGETFLAQGLQCARCHDHKFDPVPTRDFYAMQAAFAPLQFADRPVPFQPWENLSGHAEGEQRVRRLLAEAEAEQQAIRDRNTAAVRAWLDARGMQDVSISDASKLPEDRRPPRNLGFSDQDLGVRKVLSKRIAYLQRQLMRYEPLALGVYSGPRRDVMSGRRHPLPRSTEGEAETVHILAGGSIASPLEPVAPGVLSVLQVGTAAMPATTLPQGTEGRRLALARWIASPDNPLSARVIANRVWQWHFGTALAANPNNFGKMGDRPSHPELLDFLAGYLIDHGWSIKSLHRLIMTSAAYRRSSEVPNPSAVAQRDPDNRLLGSFPMRRLSAEELRDAMLGVSGELNLEMAGPPIQPRINLEVALQPRHIMGSVAPAYQPSPRPEQRNRRSIYAMRIRTLPDPMMEVFNRPNSDTSCERREASTVSPQVFSLFNGRNSHQRALAAADRIMRNEPDGASRVASAFYAALGREPSDAELDRSLTHLHAMTEHHRLHPPEVESLPHSVTREMVEEMTGLTFTWEEPLDIHAAYVDDLQPWNVEPETRALADLLLVLLNSNEFVYLD